MKCPRDSHELERRRVKGPSTPVDHCPACGGIWFDQGEVAEVIGARAVTPLVIPEQAPSLETRVCPRCMKPLAVFSYPGTLTIIDACRSCRGVWLDASEMKEIHAARETGRMTCPKCETEQPKADTCASCGVVIAKALAPDARRTDRENRPGRQRKPGGIKQSLLDFVDNTLSAIWADIRGARP